jgi:hypothetical protein
LEEEAPQTTGKFGTGFITTHLLSKSVQVRSVYFDTEKKIYQRFLLDLDRDTDQQQIMIQKVKGAYKVFKDLDDEKICPQLSGYVPGEACDTCFRYPLRENGLKAALVGADDLKKSILMTMAFLEKIEEVTLFDRVNAQTRKWSRSKRVTSEDGV